MSPHQKDVDEWLDVSLPPSQIADAFLSMYEDDLLATGVALDARLQGQVADNFAERAAKTLRSLSRDADSTRCFVVFSPPRDVDPSIEDSHQTRIQAQQEIAVRLSAQTHPLVVTFFEVYGKSTSPDVYAVGDSGVSNPIIRGAEWNEKSHRWPRDMGDDFRVNPQPAVELATLWGLHWLNGEAGPHPGQYEWKGREQGSTTRYLETHEPGGADAVVATSVFGMGGIGLAWFIARRARLSQEGAADTAASPTPIPVSVSETLPALLAYSPTPADPQDASTAAGIDAAVKHGQVREAFSVLAARVLSAVGEGRDPQVIAEGVSPVEAAALIVLHAELRARDRAWREHVAEGADADAVTVPTFCAFNPFHGQASMTATVRGASASVDVPACAACRNAIGRDDAPDGLRVLVGGRVRGYADVEDSYARSMFNALSPLADAVGQPAASDPVGVSVRRRSAWWSVMRFLSVPLFIFVLAAVLGICVSLVLAAGEPARFFSEADRAARAADMGPTLFGYPLFNALRGGLLGALMAVLLFGTGAGVYVAAKYGDAADSDDPRGTDDRRG